MDATINRSMFVITFTVYKNGGTLVPDSQCTCCIHCTLVSLTNLTINTGCIVSLSGSGQYDFLTLSRGQQRTIPLTVTNHGPETLVVLAVLSSGENSEFSYNVSPTNVAVAKDATSEVTLTVQAPLSIAGNVTVSVKLTVTAVASDSTNRNDFVAVDVFASNIEPPTPPGTIVSQYAT